MKLADWARECREAQRCNAGPARPQPLKISEEQMRAHGGNASLSIPRFAPASDQSFNSGFALGQ
jgi:hypothetical protein